MLLQKIELPLLDDNPELLQTGFWGEFKSRFGWRALGFKVGSNDKGFKMLTLSRELIGSFFFCYIPFGPVYEIEREKRVEFLCELGKNLINFVGKEYRRRPVFVRFDLPWEKDEEDQSLPSFFKVGKSLFMKKAPVDVQPPSTVIMDLTSSEDELLAGMKPKTRYNIRLAFRRGVRVVERGVESIPLWYDMYVQTALRDKIAIHSLDYYTRVFETACNYRTVNGFKPPVFKLFFAEVDGEAVAGNIVSFHGDTARYMYGASTGEKRNLMPTYALQWHAIVTAKKMGYKFYDFFGISPTPDPDHPMYGLYRFKTGFGGRIVHRLGCYDVFTVSAHYKSYASVERLRRFYHNRIKKWRLT